MKTDLKVENKDTKKSKKKRRRKRERKDRNKETSLHINIVFDSFFAIRARHSVWLNLFHIFPDDHSPPSSAEVKNAWSYTSTHPVSLHGVVRC